MKTLQHRFVEFIPTTSKLEDGILYISLEYATATHKCACGCGNKVVTPISKRDWQLYFDGESISLSPSIGNWNFKCQSHYWIRNSRIIDAPSRSKKEASGSKNQTTGKKKKSEKKSGLAKFLGKANRFFSGF